ncbi:MAG: MarR family transcriptional regulator [Alphaproteobacteria bacterium]|nr:MarR family transcriptional regulator [Alphaproteobacteria bacterium]
MTDAARNHLDPDVIAERRRQTELMLAFSRVHQQILRRSAQQLDGAGIEGITPSRATALIVLFNARRPINARELAEELALSEVTVSRFIRKMEEDGWIERAPDPTDGRAMLLRPTRYAREMFGSLVKVSNAVIGDIFDGFSREELDGLTRMVARIQQNLGDPQDG